MVGIDRHADHHTMVLVDVDGFGSPARTLPHQLATREGLLESVAEALATAGVPWDLCYREDRGDGMLVLVPPEFSKAPLVEILPNALVRILRDHNASNPAAARIRLRLVVHAGKVQLDERGATSTSLTTAFRLLDAPALKRALARSLGVLAMIVSRPVFDEVVRHSAVLNPATFRSVEIKTKGTRDLAWIAIPDDPYRPDPAVLTAQPPGPTSPDTAPSSRAVTGIDADVSANRPDDEGTSRSARVTGGVDATGSGVTIGAITGDHFTIGSPAQVHEGVSRSGDVTAVGRPSGSDEARQVTVYTSGDDGTPVRDAVVDLLEAAGFAITTSQSPQRGSWFQRLSARQKEPDAEAQLAAVTNAAVSNGLNSHTIGNVVQGGVISSVEIHATDPPREERMVNAIARLIEACREHEEVIYMPPVLLVKIGAMLSAWEPTYDERRAIDANPALLHSPHKLLAAMAALRADGQAS